MSAQVETTIFDLLAKAPPSKSISPEEVARAVDPDSWRKLLGHVRATAIGLALTLIHLIGIPITNLSVNPARSTGPALFLGGWALTQLWLFWVAPIIGGIAGGGFYAAIFQTESMATQVSKIHLKTMSNWSIFCVQN